MPVTPFHFGPGAALCALAPRQLSFAGFCCANILMDVEPLYFMIVRQAPLHRFLHTWVGATLIACAVALLFMAARGLAGRWRPSGAFAWQQLKLVQVVLGAFAGSYSHIVLDSIMHQDMRPLAPFSDLNPFLELVTLSALHWFCLLAGLGALLVLGLRRLKSSP